MEWYKASEVLPEEGADVLFNVPHVYGVEKGRLFNGKWVSDRTSPYNDEVSWEQKDGVVDWWTPTPQPPQ